MPEWIRNLIRLSWVDKPQIRKFECWFCDGQGRRYPDGTPAAIGEVNPNIQDCGNCGGRGIVFGGRIV